MGYITCSFAIACRCHRVFGCNQRGFSNSLHGGVFLLLISTFRLCDIKNGMDDMCLAYADFVFLLCDALDFERIISGMVSFFNRMEDHSSQLNGPGTQLSQWAA